MIIAIISFCYMSSQYPAFNLVLLDPRSTRAFGSEGMTAI